MLEPSENAAQHMHARDIFALLFAVICGLLLGIAAAPMVLPKLGFAGFAQYVAPRTAPAASSAAIQGNRTTAARHPLAATAPPRPVAHARTAIRPAHARPAVKPPISRPALNAVASGGVRAPFIPWFELNSLFGLALLALAFVLWLRRDLFATLLCRWAKDPRTWRGKAEEGGVVNARCVLYFEGNAYRLGAEFFSQSVEVRSTPLFVRVNMRGSDRSIVLPRRVPRIAARRRAAVG